MADVPAWPVIGHSTGVSFLQRAVLRGLVSHAYLLVGPSAVGKTTVAQHFAAALLCDVGSNLGYACDECRSCHQRIAGVHPDFFPLSPFGPADDLRLRPVVSLEDVKQLQARISRRPILATRNVALISGTEHLSDKAANALLKTVEEPGRGVVILLTCDAAERIPATLRSRCVRITLSLVPRDQIDAALRDRGVPHRQAEAVAALSFGRPGRALDMISDPELGDRYAEAYQRFNEYLRQSFGSRLRGAQAWHREALLREDVQSVTEQLHQMLSLWVGVARNYLLQAAGSLAVPDLVLTDVAPVVSAGQWARFIDELKAVQGALRQNVNPRLAIEVLLMAMPAAG